MWKQQGPGGEGPVAYYTFDNDECFTVMASTLKSQRDDHFVDGNVIPQINAPTHTHFNFCNVFYSIIQWQIVDVIVTVV